MVAVSTYLILIYNFCKSAYTFVSSHIAGYHSISAMWRAQAGSNVTVETNNDDDEWETDPDFEVIRLVSNCYLRIFETL